MVPLRFLAVAVLSSGAVCSSPALADLSVTLTSPKAQAPQSAPEGKEAPPTPAPALPKTAVAPNPAAKITAAPVRGNLPSRSMPVQIGVQRRGGPPVLPPVDGSARLPEPAPSPAQATLQVNARLGRIIAPTTDLFRMPDPRTQWVSRLVRDQQVAIVSQWEGWFAVVMGDGSQAYVPQTHVEVLPYQVKTVIQTPPTPTPAPAPQVSEGGQYEAPRTELARRVIEEAFRYEGTPYVWGGNTQSGIDCSGLVKNCFRSNGVSLPRRASEQAQVGQEVELDQLQPGDRLYFSVKKAYDHTGIYLGNGYFIHAGRSRGGVGVDHLSQKLYRDHLTAARRM